MKLFFLNGMTSKPIIIMIESNVNCDFLFLLPEFGDLFSSLSKEGVIIKKVNF